MTDSYINDECNKIYITCCCIDVKLIEYVIDCIHSNVTLQPPLY